MCQADDQDLDADPCHEEKAQDESCPAGQAMPAQRERGSGQRAKAIDQEQGQTRDEVTGKGRPAKKIKRETHPLPGWIDDLGYPPSDRTQTHADLQRSEKEDDLAVRHSLILRHVVWIPLAFTNLL